MYRAIVFAAALLVAPCTEAAIVSVAPQTFVDTDTHLEWTVTSSAQSGWQVATPAQFLQMGSEYIGPQNDGPAPNVGGTGEEYYSATATFLQEAGFYSGSQSTAEYGLADTTGNYDGVFFINSEAGYDANLDVGGYYVRGSDAGEVFAVRDVPEASTYLMILVGFVGGLSPRRTGSSCRCPC